MLRYTPLLALVLTGCGAAARPNSGTASAPPDLDFPVGHFSLTERSGRTVTEQDLRGSVWVASFVFTRCMGPCPQVTATVSKLQQELKGEPGIKFVTFTVDPSHDDMTKLREYAKHFNATDRWLFLTGDEATIHKLMKEQFKQAVERKTGDVKPGDEFGHSTRLLLVDKQGLIRASFDGMADDQFPEGEEHFKSGLKRLKERARELAKD
jgi:protein SCO1/2